MVYWLTLLLYILLVGTTLTGKGIGQGIGNYGTTLWLAAVVCAWLQDIFLLQPLRIWAQFILCTYSCSEELLALYECLRTRAKTLMTRQRGLVTNTRSLTQHFNPACRCARMFPHLPSSRLLLSINDFDLPINHRLQSLLPERNFKAEQPSLVGVGTPAPEGATYAVLARSHTVARRLVCSCDFERVEIFALQQG